MRWPISIRQACDLWPRLLSHIRKSMPGGSRPSLNASMRLAHAFRVCLGAPPLDEWQMSIERWLEPDQLAEAQCVAHLVWARKRTREAESLAFEQAPGSRVFGTRNRSKLADPRHLC